MFLTENKSLADVVSKLSDVALKYTERRSALDSQRFLASWRWSTENAERKNDCALIQAVVAWVGEHNNRLEYLETYGEVDLTFKQSMTRVRNDVSLNEKERRQEIKKMYDRSVLSFLNHAMLGAMIFTLSKITKSYTNARLTGCDEASVKNYSALAHVLLSKFSLEKLSDIDPLERLSCLQALDQLIQAIDAGHQKNKSLASIQWHPSYSNEALLTKLGEEIKAIELEIKASTAETRATASVSAL